MAVPPVDSVASTDCYLAWPRPHARGHQPSFAVRSKTRPRQASERQLSGDELESRFGSTRPYAGAREGLLRGALVALAAQATMKS